MITIIRYRNDAYFGINGKIEYPSTMHSGFTNEENRIMENYRRRIEEFEKIREGAIFLNKVHAKKALDAEVPNWQEKFQSELGDIEYKINNIQSNWSEQLWKRKYTFYHLDNISIEDLTKPTN